MSLKNLNNQELIASTKRALQVSRKAEVEVLRHFREIEDRKLWVESGSLYKFIEATFELTADQIYPRLQAMRLTRVMPEVEQKLELGELSVTNVLKAQQVFKAESKERMVSLGEKREILKSLENASTKEADKILAERYPLSKTPTEKMKPLANNQTLIQFYAGDATVQQIEELKARYSHQMPSGKFEDLLKILIQKANPEVKPRKRVTIKTRSRYISANVKREMEKTRHLGCAYVDSKTGKRCGSKHFLQRDHIHEYGQGGSNERENLQWMCGAHNRFRFKTRSTASNELGGPEGE